MKLDTRHFGEIDIDESKIIVFEEGLPGFRGLKNFALFHDVAEADAGDASVFMWLQSLEDGGTAFVLLNTFLFMPSYAPKFDDNALESLGACELHELLVRNIAVIPERLEDMTVNLCAPILINTKTQKGKQALATNKDYHVRHYIMKEAREAM
ncbi:MAG: flagellar assembly protein FliW [Defluviitaleaceae bacterium]|nr:flagellar assembly protein FliW [Defluviitaleaceae bacterium]